MTAREPQALRKYRLLAEIGRGGMADVYVAVVQGPAGFNKLMVIKKARPELAQDPEFLTMFLDEARLAARLNHPNVVQTHEIGQDGDRYFIAMEYLEGQPLHRIRARVGAAMPIAMQVRVLADALVGLHHAHELTDFDGAPLGVVHRDATPQNIFVTYDGVVKVVDFGIAKAVDSVHETRTGVVKGKIPYMAPEQARGVSVDRRTDVFSVGVMLWEALVGHRMWKGVADMGVIHGLMSGELPKLREAAPDAPVALAAICERALAMRPEERYETALEMHEALERWLATTPERLTARDVGKLVAERFADERAKVKALIDAQLRDVRWSGSYPQLTGLELPRIDPSQLLVTPTGSGDHPMVTPSHPSVQASSMTASTRLLELTSSREQKPIALIAAGTLAAASLIVLGVKLIQASAPPPAATTAVTETAEAPVRIAPPAALAPAPGQDAVKLTVRISPPSAKVFLDDALLSVGPFEGKLVKSDKPRKVRVEAPRFVSKEETVTLTGDVMLSFSLEREAPLAASRSRGAPEPPAPAPPPTTAAAPAPPPPPTPAPTPSGPKPRRTIDSASPYQ